MQYYNTCLRIIMSALTVTLCKSLFLFVKFQQTSHLLYAEFLTAWSGISSCTDTLWITSFI